MSRSLTAFAFLLTLLAGASAWAHADTVIVTLGNAMPGFDDGDQPDLVPDVLDAQTGQPAPFDTGIGNQLFGPNFSALWTFNYALGSPIISALITIGI